VEIEDWYFDGCFMGWGGGMTDDCAYFWIESLCALGVVLFFIDLLCT